MKKTSIFAALIMSLTALFSSAASAADISIVVNGNKIETEAPPIIVEDRTLVPLRAISEALGCDVAWDGNTNGVTLTDGQYLYFTWIGKDTAFKSTGSALESSCKMDVAPLITNDRTMVPLRAIAELFGAEVDWKAASSTVTVDYEKKTVKEGLAAEFNDYEKLFSSMYDKYTAYVNGTAQTVNIEIQLEDGGNIGLELYPDLAPETVKNFVSLISQSFFDGKVFHRVIKDFMIQGGAFDTDFKHHEAASIKGEFLANGYFNMIPHTRGTISMARASQDMNSASSQFFIVHKDYPSLNGQYAAFGKVTSGMEYVDAIAETETGVFTELDMEDVPKTAQVIKTVVIK